MNHSLKTHPAVVAEIEGRVLQAALDGAKRISVLSILSQVRDDLKLSANNSDAPRIADDLIARHPHLDAVIQRRTRGVRGPNKRKAAPDLAAITAVLGAHGFSIESIALTGPDGRRWNLAPAVIDRALARAA